MTGLGVALRPACRLSFLRVPVSGWRHETNAAASSIVAKSPMRSLRHQTLSSGRLTGHTDRTRKSGLCTVCRHPCKSSVKGKRKVSGRARESAHFVDQDSSCARAPLGGWSLHPCRTGHPFAASGSAEPSPKIEFVFSASPETIRREPPEFDLLRSVGYRRDLAACAFMNPDVFAFSLLGKVLTLLRSG